MKTLDKAMLDVIDPVGDVLKLGAQVRNKEYRPTLPATAGLDRFLLDAVKDTGTKIKN